jgi:hypothetical protein
MKSTDESGRVVCNRERPDFNSLPIENRRCFGPAPGIVSGRVNSGMIRKREIPGQGANLGARLRWLAEGNGFLG